MENCWCAFFRENERLNLLSNSSGATELIEDSVLVSLCFVDKVIIQNMSYQTINGKAYVFYLCERMYFHNDLSLCGCMHVLLCRVHCLLPPNCRIFLSLRSCSNLVDIGKLISVTWGDGQIGKVCLKLICPTKLDSNFYVNFYRHILADHFSSRFPQYIWGALAEPKPTF